MLDTKVDPETVSPGDVIQSALVETLKDDAVRREVFDLSQYKVEGLTIADVHNIMDDLLEVLGESHG